MNVKFHRRFLFGNLIIIITLISLTIYYGFINELNNYYKREVFIFGFSALVLDLLCIIFLFYQTIVNENNNDVLLKRFFFTYAIVTIIELIFFIKYSSFLDENEKLDKKYVKIEICFYLMFSYFLLHFLLIFYSIVYLIIKLILVSQLEEVLNISQLNQLEPSAPPIDDFEPSASPIDESSRESVRISIDNCCIVCYEKEANKFLRCAHKLCDECYEKIKEINSLCPICREKY